MNALNGLLNFFSNIWQYVLSLIKGMAVVVDSLLNVTTLAGSAVSWMPSFFFSLMISSLALIVVLRIVGR